MNLEIDPKVARSFPGLRVLLKAVEGVKVEGSGPPLLELKAKVVEEVKAEHSLESLKDEPVFRAYRDFFWRAGIDPTKVRPAGEALTRRALAGKPIPAVNNLVDAYNLASLKTGVALAAFDLNKLKGQSRMRYARKGERFLGIGMKEPMELEGREIVISDEEKLVAIYPYRDAEETKVTKETRNVLILSCGVPGVPEEALREAEGLAVSYVTRFCGGKVA